MTTNTTTTIVDSTDATKTTTTVVQEVEGWYDSEKFKFHELLAAWGNHLVNVTKSSAFVAAAYAAYQFARHLV